MSTDLSTDEQVLSSDRWSPLPKVTQVQADGQRGDLCLFLQLPLKAILKVPRTSLETVK